MPWLLCVPKPSSQYLIAALKTQDVVDEIKGMDFVDLGFKVFYSKKRRYDHNPPTKNWNDGSDAEDPLVRFKWYLDLCVRARGYCKYQASNRDHAKGR